MTFIKQLVKQIFQFEAQLILKKYKPKIIAITGSVGKTTTRDAIYLVLSKKFFVRKSEKSFTTELGIPLTIIGCHHGSGSVTQWIKNIFIGLKLLITHEAYPEWLILEIDGDKMGDFKGLSEWFHPDILVVTVIGDVPTHVESFGDIDQLLLEKGILFDVLTRDGLVVYNIDDTRTSQFVSVSNARKVSCGITVDCDIRGKEFDILYGNSNGTQIPTGMSFEIHARTSKSDTGRVTIFNSIGVHNEYACLIAYAIGVELGVPRDTMLTALNTFETLSSRMNIISGIKDTVIIDDSYNASPVATQESLQTFFKIQTTGRKIIVFGDMLELGKYSIEEHKKIAKQLINADFFIAVGIRSRDTAEELLSTGFIELHVLTIDTAEQAGKELQQILVTGDTVFIKGSQAMRMERAVVEIMRHPEDAHTLVTRQDPEWLSRQ